MLINHFDEIICKVTKNGMDSIKSKPYKILITFPSMISVQ